MEEKNEIGIPQNKPHYRKAFIYLYLIDGSLKKIRSQFERIENGKQKEGVEHLSLLFGDIHFLLIAATNLNKTLKALSELLSDDEVLKGLYKKYKPLLKVLNDLRDHSEHILEGRLEGMGAWGKEELKEPGMLGNLSNDEYNFGGDKINLIEAAESIYELEAELKIWNKKSLVCPLWSYV